MEVKMKFNFMFGLLLAALLLLPVAARAEDSAQEDLRKQVEILKAEVARLKAQGAMDERLAELERRIDLLAQELEKSRSGVGEETAAPLKGQPGLGPAASKIYGKSKGVSLGGYGEVIYDHPADTQQDGAASGL